MRAVRSFALMVGAVSTLSEVKSLWAQVSMGSRCLQAARVWLRAALFGATLILISRVPIDGWRARAFAASG